MLTKIYKIPYNLYPEYSIPRSGRSPREGHGDPVQYS